MPPAYLLPLDHPLLDVYAALQLLKCVGHTYLADEDDMEWEIARCWKTNLGRPNLFCSNPSRPSVPIQALLQEVIKASMNKAMRKAASPSPSETKKDMDGCLDDLATSSMSDETSSEHELVEVDE